MNERVPGRAGPVSLAHPSQRAVTTTPCRHGGRHGPSWTVHRGPGNAHGPLGPSHHQVCAIRVAEYSPTVSTATGGAASTHSIADPDPQAGPGSTIHCRLRAAAGEGHWGFGRPHGPQGWGMGQGRGWSFWGPAAGGWASWGRGRAVTTGRPVAMSAWMAAPQALGLLPESPVYITWAEDPSAPGRASDGRSHLQSPPAPTLNPAPSGLGKRVGDWGHIQTN